MIFAVVHFGAGFIASPLHPSLVHVSQDNGVTNGESFLSWQSFSKKPVFSTAHERLIIYLSSTKMKANYDNTEMNTKFNEKNSFLLRIYFSFLHTAI